MLVPKGGIIGDVVEVYLFIYFLSPCFFIYLFVFLVSVVELFNGGTLVYAGSWGPGGTGFVFCVDCF